MPASAAIKPKSLANIQYMISRSVGVVKDSAANCYAGRSSGRMSRSRQALPIRCYLHHLCQSQVAVVFLETPSPRILSTAAGLILINNLALALSLICPSSVYFISLIRSAAYPARSLTRSLTFPYFYPYFNSILINLDS